jgi:hypothetical protein
MTAQQDIQILDVRVRHPENRICLTSSENKLQ